MLRIKTFLFSVAFLTAFCTLGQTVNDSHPDTGEPTYTYRYISEFQLLTHTWNIEGTGTGTVLTQSVSGTTYTATIKFNTPGAAIVKLMGTHSAITYFSRSVTVVEPPAAPTGVTPVYFCGSTSIDLPSPPSGVKYYWQTSAIGKSTSDTAPSKSVETSNTTLYIRAKFTAFNNWSTSSLTVNPTIYGTPSGAISGPSAPFYNTAVGQLQASLANGTSTVEKWQSRAVFPSEAAWTDVSGSAGLNTLSFAAVTESTDYKVVLANGPCAGESPVFTVNVVQHGFEGRISGSIKLYGDVNTGALELTGCTGTIDEWQYSSNGNTWTSIPSAGGTLSIANLTARRYYRVKVSRNGTVSFSPAFLVNWYSSVTPGLVNTNAFVEETIRVPQSSEANLAAMTPLQKTTAYAYSDGLGRTVQTVVKNASPSQKDVIGFSVYDELGRQQRTYLPYTGTGNNYYDTPISDQATFYDGTPKVAIDAYPFADVTFDGSPLNRVIEQGTVGETGQLAEHHTVRMTIRTNVANEIRIWKTDATSPGYYAPGTLHVQEATDQNDNKVITFTDNRGLLIQKHVQSTASAWLKTLYIYDVSGRVKYIFQPELVRLIGTNATVTATNLLRYTFQYTYDSKGRIAEKQTPGASAAVYVVYDPLDRPILAQDGNLRASNKWAFVKYDGQGRPVMQGLYTNTTLTTQAGMQELMDGLYTSGNADYPANAWYEERGTTLHGYTNVSFPKENAGGTPIEVLSVSFYDGYDFDDADTAPDFAYTSQGLTCEGTAVDAYALPTGSKRLVLGTSTWLYAYVFYDKYGRAIQSRSNNHMNPTVDNLITTVYDFEGKVRTTKTYHHAGAAGQTTIVNKYTYDDSGHLIKVYQNNNNASVDQLVAQYEYNELGQIVDKKLHNTTGTDFLQSVDYRYNINGSLSSINNSQMDVNPLTNDDSNDYFGMEFLYDIAETSLNNTPLYNGNISAIKWKGAGAASGAVDKKAYVYEYDKADRLLTAAARNFSGTAWTKELGVHNEVLTYDNNGNIKTLKRYQRKHQLNGTVASYVYDLIDNLTYTYIGNTMTKVEDAIAFSAGQTGFNNGSVDPTEYTYNNAGSLTADKNKGISSIAYNELGKPVTIQFTDGRKVEYVYDAAGNKLTVKNYTAASTTPQTTSDYVGSFVYENNALTLFSSPEGRVVNKNGTLEYEYNIADHQGNTRVVFSSVAPTPDAPMASFEGNAGDNASAYANIEPSNVVSFASANHTSGGIKVLRMNQTTKIAATKSLNVYPGDKVDLEVWEYHEGSSGFGTTSTPASTVISMIAGAFATGVPSVDAQISNGVNTGVTAFGAGGGNQGDARPAAYLNYILFDKNYNVLTMGWQLAPAATFTKQKLSFSTLNIKEEGYLFAYLSYDDDSNNWVYFDDLKVTHTKTNIVQYNEYYPFGLQAATSWTRPDAKNNFLYNQGGELNSETGVYDLHYRNYDPVLGRLTQVDPMAGLYKGLSPYAYALNNPIVLNDPYGDVAGKPGDYSLPDWPSERRLRWLEENGYTVSPQGIGGSGWAGGGYSGGGSNAGQSLGAFLDSHTAFKITSTTGFAPDGSSSATGNWVVTSAGSWYGGNRSNSPVGGRPGGFAGIRQGGPKRTEPKGSSLSPKPGWIRDLKGHWAELKKGWQMHMIPSFLLNLEKPQIIIVGRGGEEYALRKLGNGSIGVWNMNDKNNIMSILEFTSANDATGTFFAGFGIYNDDPRNAYFGSFLDRVYVWTESWKEPGLYWNTTGIPGVDENYFYKYRYDDENQVHIMEKTDVPTPWHKTQD